MVIFLLPTVICQCKLLSDLSILQNLVLLALLHFIVLLLLFQGVSKGLVAEKALSSMTAKGRPADLVLCIGDDRSDEDMFEGIAGIVAKNMVASNKAIFGCTVGQKPSKARYYLDDTNDVLNTLSALADASLPFVSVEEKIEPAPSAQIYIDNSQ